MEKERKKNIIIYVLILVSFILFSIIVVKNMNENDNKNITNHDTKVEDNIVVEDKSTNEKSTKKDDEIEIQSEKECKSVVTKFLKNYHKIDDEDVLNHIDNAKDTLVEQLYLQLRDEVKEIDRMPKHGYIYRTVEEIKICDYKFNSESKDIVIGAKVYSNWLDKDKSIVAKNELTEYSFLLINDMGKWKIGEISSDII
ncbi:MAG: hypothetical protein E6342_17685 [Clostridium sp.]|uniref:hypothetical protein n=1 Tax=Clostridium sp. TaxID=1506 RepID=UPI001F3E6168|nr:hypothetical protein [Clostridium sp.]MDU4843973.1 hypothetical protein [Leclercia adecarboxylata]MDU7089521.1 hypothetical protein [Clostridium sp.]